MEKSIKELRNEEGNAGEVATIEPLEVVCILDQSGSMQTIVNDVTGGFNSFVKKERKSSEGTSSLTLVTFNTEHKYVQENKSINDIEDLTNDNYSPGGGTALLDAIGSTIESVDKRLEDDQKVIFVIITDGEENSSSQYTLDKIKELVKEQQDKGREFVFLGANIDSFAQGGNMGFMATSSANFTANARDTRVMYAASNTAVDSYRIHGSGSLNMESLMSSARVAEDIKEAETTSNTEEKKED